MSKLCGFPPVYYITLADSVERQQRLENHLLSLGVNFTKVIALDGRTHDFTNDSRVTGGPPLKSIESGHIATILSHLKAIEQWYYTSNTDTAIFLEDDMNLSLCNYWTFTWQELIAKLNRYYWNVVQLSLARGQDAEVPLDAYDVHFRRRSFYNWSVGAYMITRQYAKKLLDIYTRGDTYNLVVDRWNHYYPYAENIVYIAGRPHEFTIPLFVEDTTLNSTFYPQFITTKHKLGQVESSLFVQAWWQSNGSHTNIDDFMQLKEARYWEHSGTPSGWEFILK